MTSDRQFALDTLANHIANMGYTIPIGTPPETVMRRFTTPSVTYKQLMQVDGHPYKADAVLWDNGTPTIIKLVTQYVPGSANKKLEYHAKQLPKNSILLLDGDLFPEDLISEIKKYPITVQTLNEFLKSNNTSKKEDTMTITASKTLATPDIRSSIIFLDGKDAELFLGKVPPHQRTLNTRKAQSYRDLILNREWKLTH